MNILTTRASLKKRGIDGVLLCPLHGTGEEMCLHLFCYCPMAEAVLFGLEWGLPMNVFHFYSHMELVLYFFLNLFDDNSCPSLVTVTSLCGGTPSPKVTGLFCQLPYYLDGFLLHL